MKNVIFVLLLLGVTAVAFGQKPLSNSRKSSFYTYVYKLDDKALRLFYTGATAKIDDRILGIPIDSFKTDQPSKPHLPAGNYALVSAQQNQLHYNLVEQRSAYLKLLDNNHDIRFVLLDTANREISDAQVFSGRRQIPYDAVLHLYHTARLKKDTLFNVMYQGISNFYKIKQQLPYQPYYFRNEMAAKPGWFKKLWAALTAPLGKWFKKPRPDNASDLYPGYAVFNKPKFKHGDTVKLKAFILQPGNYRPVNDVKLLLRLQDYSDQGKIIGYVNAYRKGGFEYQFKLSDSLGLKLDRDYTITLEPLINEQAPSSKDKKKVRKVLMEGSFHYEDYELKTNKFTVRADKTEHSPGQPVSLYFRATDDNELDVPDGRVEVVLLTNSVQNYTGQHLFVPDTLWKHNMPMDAVGETKLLIPDSIFPKVRIGYTAKIVLLNSNNERHEENKYLSFAPVTRQIDNMQDVDSLSISYLFMGKPQSTKAILYQLNDHGDTLSKAGIQLPARLKIDAGVAAFMVKADSISKFINVNAGDTPLRTFARNTGDSLLISVKNPARLPFWYTVFSGDKIIDKGAGTSLDYRKPFSKDKTASVVFNYVWAGRMQTHETTLAFKDKVLKISVKQPATVYPGMQADINIHVNDAMGHPVPNADLTAWAITAKFGNNRLPELPYLGKEPPARTPALPMQISQLNTTGNLKLNWQRWSKQMGLDSIEYYKFSHPVGIYRREEPNPDSSTQVAPFVVKDGNTVPVHLLYVDETPVYFSKTDDIQRYSFVVKPGIHSLRFRTANQLIRLDSVNIKKDRKLILSVNSDTLNKRASFIAMPDTLTDYEATLISRYMVNVVPNYSGQWATITQNNHLFLLGMPNIYTYTSDRQSSRYTSGSVMVGPVATNSLAYTIQGAAPVNFIAEPGYSFLLQPGLIKEKSLQVKYPFEKDLAKAAGITDYTQYAFTQKGIDTLWQNYLDLRSQTSSLFPEYSLPGKGNGMLIISTGKLADSKLPFIRSVIVYKNDDPNYARIFPGNRTDLGYFAPGKYRILYLLKGNSYFLQENILVKPNGKNMYSTGTITLHAPDEMSHGIAMIIDAHQYYSYGSRDEQEIKETFNEKYLDATALGDEMSGDIYSLNEKETVPGAIVNVQGLRNMVVTDLHGHFKLKVPKTGSLSIMSIGYLPQTVKIQPGKTVKIYLASGSTMLKEVLINGTSSITYKVDTVQYTASAYKVRDNASVDELLKKMEGFEVGADGTVTHQGQAITKVRLNGKDYVGADVALALQNLPADVVENIQMVDDYGDQAARSGIKAGDPEKVLNITSGKTMTINAKPGAMISINDPGLLAMQSIRKNFSDYAYWQPKLVTDAQGNATFKATFPDDITNWSTMVVGMTGDRQSGSNKGSIKSYKPLSANFTGPLFAVKGDIFNPVGKVINYTADTVYLQRTFKYNGQLQSEKAITVKNSVIDTFKLTAAGKDSLEFEYTVKKANGYFDGEKRSIPLFEQGTLETKGMFASLDRDTTLTIQLDPKLKEGTFRAEASVLPSLLDEAQHLRDYEYLCNEQLASKLKALLSEKKIRAYLGEPFKYDKNITEIIKKLQENRRAQGTWGWWKDTDEELWISLHAAEALMDAEAAGFKTQLDKQRLIDYLLYQSTAYQGEDKLTVLMLLKKLGAKADYAGIINDYAKQLATTYSKSKYQPSHYEQLRLMLVKQQNGQAIQQDSLSKWMHQTMFGSVYWGDSNYEFFNNAIQQSLLVYQLLKTEGKHPELLAKLRNYFLEQRKDGYWRNTYESALILETILPDLLVNGKKPEPSVITLRGNKNETVTQFPYTTTLTGDASLTVKKTGTMPVYITAYQKFWNPAPQKVSKDFTVNTKFEKNGDTITTVKGGETIILKAEVIARADADYVMVEIPIPAGCSYLDKNQAYGNGEVHREYFKNKVSIFCRKLTAGKHTFTITLTSRYGGTYNVNPAKAEMMYFPVFYGRERMKVFKIE
ncbi:MAG: alpha-2-macroglobulin family protein [Bacteroidota bacterium]